MKQPHQATARDSSNSTISLAPDGGCAFTNENSEELTLFDCMGGEAKIQALTKFFMGFVGEQEELARFFVNVPVAAIQLHQCLFFKVLFGAKEERPTADELLDYMIVTHVRLFRDLGLNGKHFDMVGECFVKALNRINVPQDLIDECLAVIIPLRAAFEYGAAVAKREAFLNKNKKQQKRANLPIASAQTMRSLQEAVLPPGIPPPPQWLVQELGSREQVRAWTCALTLRFTDVDPLLSPIFMSLAYLDMEPYLHNFLQLAFGKEDELHNPAKVLRLVRFPRGLSRAWKLRLTQGLFECMIRHFHEVGRDDLLVGQDEKLWLATERLKRYTSALEAPRRDVFGAKDMADQEIQHRLRRNPNDEARLLVAHKKNKVLNKNSGPQESTRSNTAAHMLNETAKHSKISGSANTGPTTTRHAFWRWVKGRRRESGSRDLEAARQGRCQYLEDSSISTSGTNWECQ